MTEILNCLSRPYPPGESAVKSLSQVHNKMARVGFEPRPRDHNHRALTTRSTDFKGLKNEKELTSCVLFRYYLQTR